MSFGSDLNSDLNRFVIQCVFFVASSLCSMSSSVLVGGVVLCKVLVIFSGYLVVVMVLLMEMLGCSAVSVSLYVFGFGLSILRLVMTVRGLLFCRSSCCWLFGLVSKSIDVTKLICLMNVCMFCWMMMMIFWYEVVISGVLPAFGRWIFGCW